MQSESRNIECLANRMSAPGASNAGRGIDFSIRKTPHLLQRNMGRYIPVHICCSTFCTQWNKLLNRLRKLRVQIHFTRLKWRSRQWRSLCKNSKLTIANFIFRKSSLRPRSVLLLRHFCCRRSILFAFHGFRSFRLFSESLAHSWIFHSRINNNLCLTHQSSENKT